MRCSNENYDYKQRQHNDVGIEYNYAEFRKFRALCAYVTLMVQQIKISFEAT